MGRISDSWAAVRYSFKFWFWTVVQVCFDSINREQQAALELSAFNPESPSEMYRAGYALFMYSHYSDCFEGLWRDPDDKSHPALMPEYRVTEWSGVPWHAVTFSNSQYRPSWEVRAVKKEYCEKHLRVGQLPIAP